MQLYCKHFIVGKGSAPNKVAPFLCLMGIAVQYIVICKQTAPFSKPWHGLPVKHWYFLQDIRHLECQDVQAVWKLVTFTYAKYTLTETLLKG